MPVYLFFSRCYNKANWFYWKFSVRTTEMYYNSNYTFIWQRQDCYIENEKRKKSKYSNYILHHTNQEEIFAKGLHRRAEMNTKIQTKRKRSHQEGEKEKKSNGDINTYELFFLFSSFDYINYDGVFLFFSSMIFDTQRNWFSKILFISQVLFRRITNKDLKTC